jgi:serine/threonine-protein kinase
MIGSRLGSWVIDRELGRGGMGCVYQAHAADPNTPGPRLAAVKVLATELAAESGFLQRFQREIDILRKLDHPNIVRFYESGREGPHYYFAMEYVDGHSYQALITERGRLPWPEVLDLALQVAPALKHAHDRGVVHRDLKPSNLLRARPDPEKPGSPAPVKLTDFGIASLFASKHLTVTGGVVGTGEYLSPEQAAGKPVSRRSDLYSLGAVLYTLLTGRTPFEGELLDLLHKHRFAQFERPSRLVPETPPDLEDIICELLAKDPARRPPDGSVLFRRLDSLRRKMERIATGRSSLPPTVRAGDRPVPPGPATLMSKLMREELDQQNRGGPLRRFFNRPLVLVVLFLTTVGLIVWGLWPLSPEQKYERGAKLMASSDPDDWDKGWDKYLQALDASQLGEVHQEELAEFRRRMEGREAERRAGLKAHFVGPPSEAQWFYELGLRQRQQGDEKAARATWKRLSAAFRDVPQEAPWVRRAEKELNEAKDATPGDRRWETLQAALERARELRKNGRADDADAILRALDDLYHDDPEALRVIRARD